MSNTEKELKLQKINKEQENENEDKKAKNAFIGMIVIGGIFGFIIGTLANVVDVDMKNLTSLLANVITDGLGFASPFIMLVFLAVCGIYVKIQFSKAKKQWESQQNTNENVYEEVDAKLSAVLSVINVFTIFSYFLFSVSFYYFVHFKKTPFFGMALLLFVLSMVLLTIYQKKVINFCKIMNPEKEGSVYDLKFQEKWLESCDEREQLLIYQCGYKAYQVTNMLCMILWVVFTSMALFLKITLWPVTIVTLFWLVITLAYLIEGSRLEKKALAINNNI